MVTCQTVLMHVKDPALAIHEMIRVLKPGGLLAVAEPSNLGVTFTNINFTDSVDDISRRLRANIFCLRGRASLKEGNYAIALLLPEIFHQAGLIDMKIYLNDLANNFIPPYETAREKEYLSGLNQLPNILSKMEENLRRLYIAGGGAIEEFEQYWKKALDDRKQMSKAFKEKKLCSAGGHAMYLISGRK